MSRTFIIAFILMATLSMVNAIPLDKRTAVFNKCPFKDTPTLSVSLIPDSVVAGQPQGFSVTGTLNDDVTSGQTELAIVFADASGKKILEDVYYQSFTQSFPAGSQVAVTAQNVPTPKELPSTYTIGVAIGDPAAGPEKPLNIYGCTYAVIGGTPQEVTDLHFDQIPSGSYFN